MSEPTTPDPSSPQPVRSDRRERILQVAVEEFAGKGFAAVRIDEIARRAGSNKQLIYYYFGNKSGLYEAVLDQMVNGAAHVWEEMRSLSLREAVQRLRVGPGGPNRRNWGRLTVWEGAEYGAVIGGGEIHLEERRSRVWATLTEVVRNAQKTGEVDPSLDPVTVSELVALAISAPNSTPQLVKMITGDAPDSDAYRRRSADLVDLLLERLRPAPPLTDPANRRTKSGQGEGCGLM